CAARAPGSSPPCFEQQQYGRPSAQPCSEETPMPPSISAPRSLPGQRGIQHFGLTVPNLDEAVSFFCEVLGCEPFFELGTFAFDDDWMHEHLNVHPRAVIRNFQMLRC